MLETLENYDSIKKMEDLLLSEHSLFSLVTYSYFTSI